jgi:hypothetical protein
MEQTEEFVERLQEQVIELSQKLKGEIITHEYALAHFLVYTSLLYTGFNYGTDAFGVAFKAAIQDVAPTCSIVHLDKPSGLPS